MYLHKYGWLFRLFYPNLLWKVKTNEKVIYLTFDDGPIPEVTPYVLSVLNEYKAKATFFCVGENIRKNPSVYKEVLANGHSVGNHTQHHLNGRKYTFEEYKNDVDLCDAVLGENNEKQLFRPPYGRMKFSQLQFLKRNYKVVMWDVLSADFHPNISAEKCLQRSIQHTEKGSVVLMHDSVKTISKIKTILPAYLDHFTKLGFQFQSL